MRCRLERNNYPPEVVVLGVRQSYRSLAANARRHAMHAPLCNITTLTRRNSTNMDPIKAAIEAIKLRKLGEDFTYTEYAVKFSVDRSTLSRRHRRVTESRTTQYNNQRNLS